MRRIRSGLLLAFILIRTQPAEPCSCVRVGEDAPGAMLKGHKLVLLAKVTRVEKGSPPADARDLPETMWPLRVTLVPEHIWKGHRQREYTASTDAPWNTCGYAFAVGERYLIYSVDGTIPSTKCDAIYRVRDAAKHIHELDRATDQRGSTTQ